MRQLTFLGPGQLAWDEVPAPVLGGPAEALVAPVAVVTCDLDAAAVQGRAPLPGPFAFGHEAVPTWWRSVRGSPRSEPATG